jgi:hypothetical protein
VDKARIEGEGDEYLFLNDNAFGIALGATFDVEINEIWS